MRNQTSFPQLLQSTCRHSLISKVTVILKSDQSILKLVATDHLPHATVIRGTAVILDEVTRLHVQCQASAAPALAYQSGGTEADHGPCMAGA